MDECPTSCLAMKANACQMCNQYSPKTLVVSCREVIAGCLPLSHSLAKPTAPKAVAFDNFQVTYLAGCYGSFVSWHTTCPLVSTTQASPALSQGKPSAVGQAEGKQMLLARQKKTKRFSANILTIVLSSCFSIQIMSVLHIRGVQKLVSHGKIQTPG